MTNLINTYIIIPTVDLTDNMINESLNTPTTFRKSIDESKSLLKFHGTCYPVTCAGYEKYSYEEIIIILSGEEWTAEP
jgi:hypothetical protein